VPLDEFALVIVVNNHLRFDVDASSSSLACLRAARHSARKFPRIVYTAVVLPDQFVFNKFVANSARIANCDRVSEIAEETRKREETRKLVDSRGKIRSAPLS
jgi:hypothetical protein